MPPTHLHDHDGSRGVKGTSRPRSASRVRNLGTTANVATPLGDSEWSADLEYIWRVRMAPQRARLAQRARGRRRLARAMGERSHAAYEEGRVDEGARLARERVAALRSAEWAEHRALSIGLLRGDVVGTCGVRRRVVRCACGPSELPVPCDQPLVCAVCSKRHWRRWRRKLVRALGVHVGAAVGLWGRDGARGHRPGVYMITLTVPHSGDLVTDRSQLMSAWRDLQRVASAGKWWTHYALCVEVTPGARGDGHVHAHVAVISRWVPYEDLHRVWRRVSGAVSLDVQAPRMRGERAAVYMAKYLSKGAQESGMSGAKAGEWLVASAGKRKITTSRGFWIADQRRPCGDCGELHSSQGAPHSIAAVVPGAVLRARGRPPPHTQGALPGWGL